MPVQVQLSSRIKRFGREVNPKLAKMKKFSVWTKSRNKAVTIGLHTEDGQAKVWMSEGLRCK
jgi:hypothetical protein